MRTREFYTTRTSTNHDLNRESCLHDLLAAVPHEFSGVIRAFGTPAKNDVDVGIALQKQKPEYIVARRQDGQC